MHENLLSPPNLTQQLPNELAAHTYLIGAMIPLLCDLLPPRTRAVIVNLLGWRQRDMAGCSLEKEGYLTRHPLPVRSSPGL